MKTDRKQIETMRHEQSPLVLRVPAAAKALGIGQRKLWSLTNSGEIPHFRVGRAVCYRLADLDAWTIQQVRAEQTRGGVR